MSGYSHDVSMQLFTVVPEKVLFSLRSDDHGHVSGENFGLCYSHSGEVYKVWSQNIRKLNDSITPNDTIKMQG